MQTLLYALSTGQNVDMSFTYSFTREQPASSPTTSANPSLIFPVFCYCVLCTSLGCITKKIDHVPLRFELRWPLLGGRISITLSADIKAQLYNMLSTNQTGTWNIKIPKAFPRAYR